MIPPIDYYSNELSHNFGNSIRFLRKREKYSMEDLSRIFSVDRRTISKIENGTYDHINTKLLIRVAKLFSVQPHDLLAGNVWCMANNTPNVQIPNSFTIDAYTRPPMVKMISNLYKIQLGHNIFEKYCKESKIDPTYFKHNQNLISRSFILRMVLELIEKNQLDYHTLWRVCFPNSYEIHGHLSNVYTNQKDRFNIVKTFQMNSHYYEEDHTYTIENENSNYIEISMIPKEHLYGPHLKDLYFNKRLGKFNTEWFRIFLISITNFKSELIKDLTKGDNKTTIRVYNSYQSPYDLFEEKY